jgi:hypothetical protein
MSVRKSILAQEKGSKLAKMFSEGSEIVMK